MSIGTPGSARGFEPVATITCFARQLRGLRARRPRSSSRLAALPPANEPRPWKNVDLVLLEQVQDAVVVLRDDLVLAREHLRDVDREALDLDAVLGEGMAGVLEVLGRLQQRLRRDAADVGAGAARRGLAVGARPVVDAGGLEAELRGADRGDVAAGAAADDDDVE